MRWSNLTGLEPETDEERKELRQQMFLFFGSFGRISVVMLSSLAVLLTADTWAQQVGEGFGWAFFGVSSFAMLWSIAPMVKAVYNLYEMRKRAHTGPRRHEWEVEDNAE